MTPTQIDKFIENEEKLEQMENDLKAVISFAKKVFEMLDIGDISQLSMSSLPSLIPSLIMKFQMGDIDISKFMPPDFSALMKRYEYLVKQPQESDQPKNLC